MLHQFSCATVNSGPSQNILPEDTLAQKSLETTHIPTPLPRGRPQTTWIKLINNDLQNLNLDRASSKKLREINKDKQKWEKIVAKSVINGKQQ